MKTHNLVIYHCLNCGAIMHCEPDEEVPQCCQKSMIKAAAETVAEELGEKLKKAEVSQSDGSCAPFDRTPR